MKITTILKRDGRKLQYNRKNITIAVWKSLRAVEEVSKVSKVSEVSKAQLAADRFISEEKLNKDSRLWREAERLSLIVEQMLVTSNGTHQWKVEEIQDVVEQTLLAAGKEEAARAYILYRNRRSSIRLEGCEPSIEGSHPSMLGMSENAYAAMAKRYLWKDKDGRVIETPKQAMARVATAVAASEKVQPWRTPRLDLKTSNKYRRDKYLEIMTSFEFVPAGCYFRGAGNAQNGSLANCFVLPVEDSIANIFDAVKWAALIHMKGGGTGFNFSHLRPRGDVVRGGGLASGPINFMKAFDAETQIVMQGGEHRGANMGILNVDHPDIFEFIKAKSVDGEISNFNISVGAFDKFMQAVEKDSDWELINPRDKSAVQKIPARQLWEEIISLAHKTGDPGMIYLDEINRHNPIMKALGPIEATNVCGEQVLHPFDVCNLGSINLSKFVIKPWWENFGKLGKLGGPEGQKIRRSEFQKIWPSDSPILRQSGSLPRRQAGPSILSFLNNIRWQRLEEVVRTAVRFLDDGIDASTYPIPQIEDMAHKLRRIGLGIMGWADMLAKLGVRYDSGEGVKLAESIMKFIQNVSWDESEKLAKEKAEFPLWRDSYFNSKNNPFGKQRKVRNVAVTTIAPTGTISMIADCSSGIEPYFALEYTKNVVEKEGLKYTNTYYDAASKALGEKLLVVSLGVRKQGKGNPIAQQPITNNQQLLSSAFRTAHEISPDWHVRMQAAFQKFTDNAVSKTINFPKEATVKDVESAYLLAWKLGCKGITVYRDGSREGQILRGARSAEQGAGSTSHAPRATRHEQTMRLMQSQMTITPLSQRAYRYERQQIVESASDGNCPECGAVMTMGEGCSTCRSCGYSKCSI